MARMNKLTSTVIMACFLINTVSTDYALALAPASRVDDLGGVENKDIFRIRETLVELMKVISKKGFEVTAESVRKFLPLPENQSGIRWYEVDRTEGDRIRIFVRITDQTYRSRPYYAEISPSGIIDDVYPKGKSEGRSIPGESAQLDSAGAKRAELIAVKAPSTNPIIVKSNAVDAAKEAARRVVDKVKKESNAILGLATGGTMVEVYKEVIRLTAEEKVDWSGIRTFNLDEYAGIPKDHSESYRNFMNRNLFDALVPFGLNMENTHVPDALAPDPQNEIDRYVVSIDEAGGVDLWLLGIGSDGHFGFLEPAAIIGTEEQSLLRGGNYDSSAFACKVRDFNEFMISDEIKGYEAVKEAADLIIMRQRSVRSNLGLEKDLVAARIKAARLHGQDLTESQAIAEIYILGKRMPEQSDTIFYVPLSHAERLRLEAALRKNYSNNIKIHGSDDYFGDKGKVVSLAIPTIIDNSRMFDDVNQVPLKAISVTGIVREGGSLLQVVTGAGKKDALFKTITLPVTSEVPSTVLMGHPDYTIIADEAAYGKTPIETPEPSREMIPSKIETTEMSRIAAAIGEKVWDRGEGYNYIVPAEFSPKGYTSRFNFQTYGGTTGGDADKLIENIKSKIVEGEEKLTIALVPKVTGLTAAHLTGLIEAKIKFVLIDPNDVLGLSANARGEQFKEHTYAAMALIRFADNETLRDPLIYSGLSYYLRSHFQFDEKMSTRDYIEAVKTGKVNELIRGYVSYRVFERFDAIPEHRTISASLIFA